MRKFLIWSYNHSLPGLVAKKVSDDTKVGYSVGANIGLVLGIAYMAYLAKNA